jgi:hypothetical protein
MSSIVPLSHSERGESLSRIGDVQQTVKENLLGAFDVTKIQAAFDILFGIISVQQSEIDKFNDKLNELNKEIPPIRVKTDDLEVSFKYNEKEQRTINADQGLDIHVMKKQIEILKQNLSDTNEKVVEIKEGSYVPVQSRAAAENEKMASSGKPDMDTPSFGDQDKTPISDSNEPSERIRATLKRHSLKNSEPSTPASMNDVNELGENLREFTTDIAAYYDSIESVLNEDAAEDSVSAMLKSEKYSEIDDDIKDTPDTSASQSR